MIGSRRRTDDATVGLSIVSRTRARGDDVEAHLPVCGGHAIAESSTLSALLPSSSLVVPDLFLFVLLLCRLLFSPSFRPRRHFTSIIPTGIITDPPCSRAVRRPATRLVFAATSPPLPRPPVLLVLHLRSWPDAPILPAVCRRPCKQRSQLASSLLSTLNLWPHLLSVALRIPSCPSHIPRSSRSAPASPLPWLLPPSSPGRGRWPM